MGAYPRFLTLSLAVTTLIALTSCTMRYTKPGLTQEQFDRDEYECRIATGPYSHNPFIQRKMLDQCMRQRGYTRE